ncbi:MAG: hypothetical protein L0Y72_05600 [Gemmataceae bacterium]|nr:hypothetical protein [Gemmataceae bacterium]MCI0738499.1 hypothetical protein [Gemmataceae bacterium]
MKWPVTYFGSFWSRIRNYYCTKSQPLRNKRKSFRPCLECFEERCVPAVATWDPAVGQMNLSASVALNWTTNAIPGPLDDVVFSADTDVRCDMDLGSWTIKSLTIEQGYTSTIKLFGGLITITNGGVMEDGRLSDGAVSIDNAGNGDFNWSGGTIEVALAVETNGRMTIEDGPVQKVVTGGQEGGAIDNMGQIVWVTLDEDRIGLQNSGSISNSGNNPRFEVRGTDAHFVGTSG